jgi:hypothetical protein
MEEPESYETADGHRVQVGAMVHVWVSMSGRHTLERGTVRAHGVITWCGDGVGQVRDRGYSTDAAAIIAGCPCVSYGKPCCDWIKPPSVFSYE